MDGWAILDLPSILFIKSELHCRRFSLLSNREIFFIKSQTIEYCVLRTNLYQTGVPPPVLSLKRLTTRLLKTSN